LTIKLLAFITNPSIAITKFTEHSIFN